MEGQEVFRRLSLAFFMKIRIPQVGSPSIFSSVDPETALRSTGDPVNSEDL